MEGLKNVNYYPRENTGFGMEFFHQKTQEGKLLGCKKKIHKCIA